MTQQDWVWSGVAVGALVGIFVTDKVHGSFDRAGVWWALFAMGCCIAGGLIAGLLAPEDVDDP